MNRANQYEQQSATNYYYTRDHLGSVREMTDGSGTIQARYDYDPYGRTTLVSGTNLSDKQYAGMYMHQPSGLYLTKYRAYDPNTAKWLSHDPIGIRGGINLYGYVMNDPLRFIDLFGLYPAGGSDGANNMTNPSPPPGVVDTTSSASNSSSGGAAAGGAAAAAAAGGGGRFVPPDSPEDQFRDIENQKRLNNKYGRPNDIFDTAKSKCDADHDLKPYNFNDPAAGTTPAEGAAGDAAAGAAEGEGGVDLLELLWLILGA